MDFPHIAARYAILLQGVDRLFHHRWDDAYRAGSHIQSKCFETKPDLSSVGDNPIAFGCTAFCYDNHQILFFMAQR